MRKHLFLYLSIICFLGLLAIFVFDGYIGVYDTLEITADEYSQIIEPDQWQKRYNPSAGTDWGGKIFFAYNIENRRFYSYLTPIKATLWQENERLLDLLAEDKSAGPFSKVSSAWTLDSKVLESMGLSSGQYTLKIERGDVERNIVVHFNVPRDDALIKPVPAPPR